MREIGPLKVFSVKTSPPEPCGNHSTSICVPGKKRSGVSLKNRSPTFFGIGDSVEPPTIFICRPKTSIVTAFASSAKALPVSCKCSSIKARDKSPTAAACANRSSNGTLAVKLNSSCSISPLASTVLLYLRM